MKINSIKLSCRSELSAPGASSTDSLLIFFRSPVIYVSGSNERRLSACSAIVVTGGYKQSFRPVPGHKLRYDCISFRMSSADKQYISTLDISADVPVELSDEVTISGLIRGMKSQAMHKSRNTAEFLELSMRLLFIVLSDAAEKSPSPEKREIPHYSELKKLRDSIYDDPTGAWDSDLLAAEMGISRAYFHRIYLAAFGVTCRQDVIESRLLYAAELLKNTDHSISVIAEQCGYESDSYFMRQFRQHKGCTPTEYRKSVKEDNM